jgi:hypothetical protein
MTDGLGSQEMELVNGIWMNFEYVPSVEKKGLFKTKPPGIFEISPFLSSEQKPPSLVGEISKYNLDTNPILELHKYNKHKRSTLEIYFVVLNIFAVEYQTNPSTLVEIL